MNTDPNKSLEMTFTESETSEADKQRRDHFKAWYKFIAQQQKDNEMDNETKPSFEEEMKLFAERTGLVPNDVPVYEGHYGFAHGKHANVLVLDRAIEEFITNPISEDSSDDFHVYVDRDLFGTIEAMDSVFNPDQHKLYPETHTHALRACLSNLASVVCEKLNASIDDEKIFMEEPASFGQFHQWVLDRFPVFPMVILNMHIPIEGEKP